MLVYLYRCKANWPAARKAAEQSKNEISGTGALAIIRLEGAGRRQSAAGDRQSHLGCAAYDDWPAIARVIRKRSTK